MLSLPTPPPKVICIDPGHPSEVGWGTRGRKLTENKANWEVALRLGHDLRAMGFKVVMTKTSENQFVRNRRRAQIANAAHALLMVRLHCDAANGSGFTTYYPDQQGVSESVRGPSASLLRREKPIAEAFHTTLAQDLKGYLQDNGLEGDEHTAVGRGQGALTGSVFSKVPVVLVEMIVLTNPHDEQLLSTPAGLQRMADALAAATKAAVRQRGTDRMRR